MVVTLDFICLRLNPETGQPEVMLQQRVRGPEQGRYALVGGWVWEQPVEQGGGNGEGGEYDRTLDDAVRRILEQKVGLMPSYLEQVRVEGSISRDPALGWSVTIPHLSLFNRDDTEVLQTRDGIRWVALESILDGGCPLPFDHRTLVANAHEAFLNKIKYSSLLLYLLPEKVAVSQIVAAYETFGIRVTKQTVFSRWVNPGLLKDTGERKALSARGQASKLYRLEEDSLSYFDSEIGKSYGTRAGAEH